MLAEKIKNRAISIETLINDSKFKKPSNIQAYVKMLVLLNSAADLKSLKRLRPNLKI